MIPTAKNASTVPTASNSNRHHGNVIIGISTGSAVFVLLLFITIIYFILRRRKLGAVAASKDAAMHNPESPEARPFSYISIQELGQQSVQELCATSCHRELFDGHAPTESGMGISELMPVSHIIARSSSAQEIDSTTVDPQTSPTYATVFSVEAYKDSTVASPVLSPTRNLNNIT